jgi:hypothetical protein
MAEAAKPVALVRRHAYFTEGFLDEARPKVMGTVIEPKGTDMEVNLIKEYGRSSRLVCDYVTLDYPHHDGDKQIDCQVTSLRRAKIGRVACSNI